MIVKCHFQPVTIEATGVYGESIAVYTWIVQKSLLMP